MRWEREMMRRGDGSEYNGACVRGTDAVKYRPQSCPLRGVGESRGVRLVRKK